MDIHPKVINLSKKLLTESEISVLKLGPKFIPTPKCNIEEMNNDLNSYCRKLRLTEFMSNHDVEADESILKPRSTFTPHRNENPELDVHIDYLKTYKLTPQKQQKSNLSKGEQLALQSLANDSSIIIKESDKGGTMVVLDKEFYKDKIETMLNDSETYKRIDNHKEENIMKKVEKFTNKYSRILTQKERSYISKFPNKDSNLYGLPKLHKSKCIKAAINEQNKEYIRTEPPDNLEFRPIISGCASPTSKLSKFMDEILKTIVPTTKSYIKDTRDFIKYINKINPDEDDILITWDIKSLYTNIKHSIAKMAISYWIENTSIVDSRFNINMILEGIDLVIKNNNFKFNNVWYNMCQGIGMGSSISPTLASLTIAYLEEKMYTRLERDYDLAYRQYVEDNLKRFIDDCFMLWKRKYGDYNNLFNVLNNMDDKIEYTMDTSDTKLPFLDVMVCKVGVHIETDVYHKETDSYNYVTFNSCHTRSTKNNIPYNLSVRLQLIVSNKETRDIRFQELKSILTGKGYPSAVIDMGIDSAKKLNRAELMEDKTKTMDNKSITFITTHNPNNPQITGVIKDNFKSIQATPSLTKAFHDKKVITAKRKTPSIKNMLTKAAFSDLKEEGGIKKCGKKCVTCSHLKEVKDVKFKNCDKLFTLKMSFHAVRRTLFTYWNVYAVKIISARLRILSKEFFSTAIMRVQKLIES